MRTGIRKILTGKYFLIPVGGLLLYTLIGFLIAPLVIRWYVPKYARENLQCEAGLEKVRINPFLLTLEANGFSITQPDGSPLAAFDRLFVDCEIAGLFRRAAAIREITLDRPQIHVVLEPDGELNLLRLFTGPDSPREPTENDSKPFPMFVENLTVHGGKASIVDRRPSKPAGLTIDTLELDLKGLSTISGPDGRYSLTAVTSEGGTIDAEGEITLTPLRANGRLALAGIKAAALWEFAQDALNIQPPEGQFDLTASCRVDASVSPIQVTLEELRVGLTGLSLKLLESDKAFLSLDKVELTAPRLDSATRTFQVQRLLVEGGAADVRIDASGRLNIQRVLREARSEQKKEEPPAAIETAPASAPGSASASASGSASGSGSVPAVTPSPSESAPTTTGSPPPILDSAPLSPDSAPPSTDSAPPSTDSAPPSTDSASPSPDSAPPSTDSAPPSTDSAPPSPDPTPPQAPEAALPAASDSTNFKVEANAIDIKGIALALEDLSRASPLRARISNIDVGFKATVETGSKGDQLQASLKEGSIELKAVHIGDTRSPEPRFRTEKLTVQGAALDLGARSFTASRIALGSGYVEVSRERDGRLNWVRLLGPGGGAPEATESEPASAAAGAWKFLVKSFEVEGFSSKLSDLETLPDKPLFNFKDFNAKVTEVDGKSPMGFALDFQVEEGGSMSAGGKVDPSIPSVEAEVKVEGLALTPLQPYLEPFITLVLRSAMVSARGDIRYMVPGSDAEAVYHGALSLDKLSLSEQNSTDTYLGFEALNAPELTLTMQPNRLEVPEIIVTRPVGELIIAEDRTVSLSRILKDRGDGGKAAPSSTPKAGESDDAFPFRIGKVRAQNGNILFADLSLKPKFQARIHELKGTVGGLASDKNSMARVQLDGRVDEYGLAKIDGVLRLYDFKRSMDMHMIFRNVEMTSLSPYSGRFAGRHIKSGKLSADLEYRIQNGKLVGDNKLIVDKLVLGERVESPDATDLPLDLAVALLKDSNGRINIGLPVAGDLDNPEFSIGPLVWKALVSILVKTVSAPFRALAGLFGGGEAEGLDSVDFEPGRDELLPPEKEKLMKLAEALRKRPELKLEVRGGYSPEVDGLELKDRNVRRAVATRLGTDPGPEIDPDQVDFTDSKTRDILEDLFKERFGKRALDELEEGIKKGTVKPRNVAAGREEITAEEHKKKSGRFSRMVNSLKLYRLIPGGKSPEEAAAWAGELYVRIVESEPVSEEALLKLARNRANAIVRELEDSAKIPASRLAIKDPVPASGDAPPAAKLSLGAL